MPATPVYFQHFDACQLDLARGKDGLYFNLETDALALYFSNAAPNFTTHAVKADLAEIAVKNGYPGMIDIVTTSRAMYQNTFRIVANDVLLTGTAANDGTGFGPFQYINLLSKTSNATDSQRRLIGCWVYPSTVTVPNGGIFNLDFSSVDGMYRTQNIQ